jgi:hypothetical protein
MAYSAVEINSGLSQHIVHSREVQNFLSVCDNAHPTDPAATMLLRYYKEQFQTMIEDRVGAYRDRGREWFFDVPAIRNQIFNRTLTFTLRAIPRLLTPPGAYESIVVMAKSQPQESAMVGIIQVHISDVVHRGQAHEGEKFFVQEFYRMHPELTRVSGWQRIAGI